MRKYTKDSLSRKLKRDLGKRRYERLELNIQESDDVLYIESNGELLQEDIKYASLFTLYPKK